MPLDELRKARRMTQARLAETLGVKQGEVSKNRLEPKPRLASTSQRPLENLVHTNIPFQ
jgi:transcriptional regulator with XRE-family HTH domain